MNDMNSAEDRLRNAFVIALRFDSTRINDNLSYGVKGWDSIAHMALIAAIESEFDIMIDTKDVIDMNGFKKAKEIVAKYGITF
jgi:acyl carrier protein